MRTCQNASENSPTSEKHLRTFGNPLELLRTDENASERIRMSKNVSKPKRTIWNRSESMRVPQNERNVSEHRKKIREHLRTLRNLWEPLSPNENTLECYHTTSKYASDSSGTFHNSWESMRKPQLTSENLKTNLERQKTFQNLQEPFRTAQNEWECFGKPQKIPEHQRMSPNLQ